jgi:hypothetical protein
MFTVSLENQADIVEKLLQLYYPQGAKIIDFTYGTGAIWWNVFEKPFLNEKYQITKTDAEPSTKLKEPIHTLDLTKDDYSQLGKHDIGVFDPPYLIGRPSFDYLSNGKVLDSGIAGTQKVISMGFQGKRSWSSTNLNKYVCNLTRSVFDERVDGLKIKADQTIKSEGLLFVKIMNPRNNGKIIDHVYTIKQKLQNFELMDELIYIRQGATTWKVKGHLQNLHGFWLIFQKKSECVLA